MRVCVLCLALCACGGGGQETPSPRTALTGRVVEIGSNSVGYVTETSGPLTGKRKLVMTYRIEGSPLQPTSDPKAQTILTLHFQRRGDNGTAQGPYEAYRWYAKFASVIPILNGEHTVEAPLDGNWTAVLTSSRANNPTGFQAALDDTENVGFVLGGGDGLGHGVRSTGKTVLTVVKFQVL